MMFSGYLVALLLVKERKPFSDGGIRKKMSEMHNSRDFSRQKRVFNTASSSRATMTRRAEPISGLLHNPETEQNNSVRVMTQAILLSY
jgi:hypothetical protein